MEADEYCGNNMVEVCTEVVLDAATVNANVQPYLRGRPSMNSTDGPPPCKIPLLATF